MMSQLLRQILFGGGDDEAMRGLHGSSSAASHHSINRMWRKHQTRLRDRHTHGHAEGRAIFRVSMSGAILRDPLVKAGRTDGAHQFGQVAVNALRQSQMR